jgi:hypothetical protein
VQSSVNTGTVSHAEKEEREEKWYIYKGSIKALLTFCNLDLQARDGYTALHWKVVHLKPAAQRAWVTANFDSAWMQQNDHYKLEAAWKS